MIVAKLRLALASEMGFATLISEMSFDDMEKAEAAYKTVAGLIEENRRGNGSRRIFEIECADARETFIAADVRTVSILDLAKAEQQAQETNGHYPLLMPRLNDAAKNAK